MYTLSDKSQVQASAIKSGTRTLAAPDQELVSWISNQFDVNALDFSCETRKTAKHSQQLVHVILERPDDAKKMQADGAGALAITERFLKYLKSDSSGDPLKRDVLANELLSLSNIIVTYRPLQEPDGKILEEMIDDERRAVLNVFEDVWVLSQTVVFYYTDAQVKENRENGTSAKITRALYDAERTFGFVKISEFRFDSKESFDRDYESNWYYYWK